jgi:HTH-type transcriptional regulator/antitoxin HigA
MGTEGATHSNLAVPPGEYLAEVLAELGMSKDELARRMGRPATKLSPIFKGEKAITPETALQLQQVVGVPAHIWTGLEAEYRLTLARQEGEEREAQLQEESDLVLRYPYRDLVKAGEIEYFRKVSEQVRALQAFLGVVSLQNVQDLQRYQPAFRIARSGRGQWTAEAVAAWLRMGERRAQKMRCAPFDKKRLQAALGDLRAMTLQSPEEFHDRLESKLMNCGVALIICPHFAKTKAHGATFWLGKDRAVLMITIRFKWADIFWFSLFHEIGHILLHGKQAVILEDGAGDEREAEADQFAADTLIRQEDYQLFVRRGAFYPHDISAFARKIGIAPGIVVGRLQHEKRLRQQWANSLRVRYEWRRAGKGKPG